MNTLNTIQKLCIVVAAAVAVVLFFLHNPFSGYITLTQPYNQFITRTKYSPCNDEEKAAMRARYEKSRSEGVYDDIPKENTDKLIQIMVNDCKREEQYTAKAEGDRLEFRDWRSRSPVVWWLANLFTVLKLAAGALFILGLIFWLFRSNSNSKS